MIHRMDLPPYWEMKIDPVTGWPFFVDHASRRTTWDDPRYYEPGTRTSASANFQSHPDNHYPSKQERCHEITNFLPNHPPSIHYSQFNGKQPANIVTEQSGYPKNAVREADSIRPLAMENRAGKPSYSTSNHVQKENVYAQEHSTADKRYSPRQSIEGNALSSAAGTQGTVSRTTDPPDFTVNEELKLRYPEIKTIVEIMEKSTALEEKVLSYVGPVGTKEYIFLEESLVAILLSLDKVETHSNSEIRRVRKSAVCKIQQILTTLENKAKGKVVTS